MLLGEVVNHAIPKPGHQTLQTLTAKKHSVIRIQNDDDLCCARVLVTAKARVDQHPKWNSIRQGRKLERELALLLHEEAHVPPGPCKYEELTKFSAAPLLYDYQILLVDADRSFHITSFGPTQPKQLILLHEKDHYNVIPSLPGFFGSSYVCAHCLKPYNDADVIDVQITTKSSAAPVAKKTARISFTPTHGVSKPPNVVVTVIATFLEILVTRPIAPKTTRENPRPAISSPSVFVDVDVPPVSNWKWGSKTIYVINAGTWIVLPATSTWTPKPIAATFREQKKKRKRSRQGGPRTKRGAAAGLQTLQANEVEEEEEDEYEEDDIPPIHVFFDIEAMQPQEQHVANLVVAETEDDDPPSFPRRTLFTRFSRMVGYPDAERRASSQRHRP